MHKPTDTGMNRTGVATSPIDSRRTVAGAEEAHTGGLLDGNALMAERAVWARSAEPLGTVPPPASVKGMVKTVLEKLEGHKPTVFIDKLGERLAFERTGARLYEAVMAKVDAADSHPGGPTRAEIEQIHSAERRHFALVRDAILQVGADPTAMTPCADLIAVTGLGWVQAVSDPRTTLNQCLGVMLIAELADHDGWHLLIELADNFGFDDMAVQFRAALAEEERHVLRVRSWITTALLGEAGVSSEAERVEPSGSSPRA
jgi:rubrerythrin